MGWNNPPRPPWNASESPQHPRRCPHDIHSTKGRRHPCGENGLKSTLRDFSNGLSLRQSCSRGSHLLGKARRNPPVEGRR